MIYNFLPKICRSSKIEKNELRRACSTQGEDKCMQGFGGKS